MEAIDISDSNLKKKLSEIGELMAATLVVDGSSVPVIADRDVAQIRFEGNVYVPHRTKAGAVRKNAPWEPW
jgi:hypothetical protein